MAEVIEYGSPGQISTIIWVIQHFNRQGSLPAGMKERVKVLWGQLINHYATGTIGADEPKILAGLFDWISVFDEIDDEMYGVVEGLRCLRTIWEGWFALF